MIIRSSTLNDTSEFDESTWDAPILGLLRPLCLRIARLNGDIGFTLFGDMGDMGDCCICSPSTISDLRRPSHSRFAFRKDADMDVML